MDDSHPRLAWQVGAAALSRLFLNTARRFVYPFAPVLSRGLGVPITAITSLIAINQVTGILSLFFGPLSDRWGYRTMMLAGLGMLAVGMLSGWLFPTYAVVMLALFLAGLGKSIFDPALQAYVAERVPYERRGLVIGVIEMSWSGATLLSIPLLGLLIQRAGWRAAFLVLGALGVLSVIILAWLMPGGEKSSFRSGVLSGIKAGWQKLARSRLALGALGYAFFVSMANDNLFVVYGVWLEDRFGLSVVALGTATIAIGIAELAGESLTAFLSDRLGLKRSVIMGLILSGLGYAALPLAEQTLPLALVGLFLVFVTVEFSIVTSISLFTELLPDARATMMSGFIAMSGMGRVAGALMGGSLWLAGSMAAVGLISAGISSLALISLLWGLHRWRG